MKNQFIPNMGKEGIKMGMKTQAFIYIHDKLVTQH